MKTKTEKTNSFEIIIGEDKAGQRIDKALSSHPMIGSRTQAAHLITKKLVFFKDKPVKASHKTFLGDHFLIDLPVPDKSEALEPFSIDLDIVYEDEDLIVVNKPSGLVVHPSLGHNNKTLVNALIYHTKDLSMGFAENRPGIVHRLDKETSGLLVIAKNNFTHEHLSQQFQQRTIQRKYWAVVYGEVKEAHGRIETFIARHPKDRKKFSSKVEQGKTAITNFKKLKYSPKGFTLLEVKLETGRTHQIRVHMSDKGFPIVADNLYGATRRTNSVGSKAVKDDILALKRIALHAKELGFIHPKTQNQMSFTSDVPKDLITLFEDIGI